MSINLDRSIFSVFCQYRTGIEATVDPTLTRAQVVENIARGELGYEDVVCVTEHNPVEGWSRIVTEDVLREAGKPDDDNESRLTGQNAIEAGWDHARAHREVA